MKNPILTLLALVGFASSATASDSDLIPSQCWTYSTRPSENASFLVIRKIEILPKIGEVAHVSVFALRIKNPSAPTGFADLAGHLPITVAALRSSIKKVVERKIPDVDWMEGYSLWREAYDSGKGGVFSKSVSDCIGFMEEAINRK